MENNPDRFGDLPQPDTTQISSILTRTIVICEVPDAGAGWRSETITIEDRSLDSQPDV